MSRSCWPGLRVRDPRVLALLLDRLEFDAGDGAFLLGLYGDQAARPALEKMLAEIPKEDAELRLEIERSIELLDAPEPQYEPEPFDILKEYPKTELPAFDLLPDSERIEMLASDDALIRAGAAHSFFNEDLNARRATSCSTLAKADPELKVRVQAWESLADAAEQSADPECDDRHAERRIEAGGGARRSGGGAVCVRRSRRCAARH